MDFRREDYRKYGTCSIIIKNALFSLKGCEVFNIEETKYGYKKATVKLSHEMIRKMKKKLRMKLMKYSTNRGLTR